MLQRERISVAISRASNRYIDSPFWAEHGFVGSTQKGLIIYLVTVNVKLLTSLWEPTIPILTHYTGYIFRDTCIH